MTSLRPIHRWWISGQLLWKVTLVLVLRLLLSYTSLQVLLCSLMLLLRLAAVLYFRPYATALQNREEISLALLSGLVLACGLGFFLSRDGIGAGTRTGLLFTVLLSLSVMFVLVLACVALVWRQLRAKQRAQKALAASGDPLDDWYESMDNVLWSQLSGGAGGDSAAEQVGSGSDEASSDAASSAGVTQRQARLNQLQQRVDEDGLVGGGMVLSPPHEAVVLYAASPSVNADAMEMTQIRHNGQQEERTVSDD